MASTLSPSAVGGTPTARLNLDLSQLQQGPQIARQAGQATAREIVNVFKQVQNEQRLAMEQARQATVTLRTQQAQISAATRAEAAVRVAAAKAEQAERTQAARAQASAVIEQERRATAEYRNELRIRTAATRTAASQQRALLRGGATFAGAAFGGPVGGIAGALAGGSAGLALAGGLAVSMGTRAAVEATQLSTAYRRQETAALRLAGSQGKLNQLLAAYVAATGGAIDRAQALADVTRLQAVGFAKSAPELERFVRAARGPALAMGKPQEDITQEVQLAISNQSIRRLDQIGLGVTEVNDRIKQLREQNAGMTREAAFQESILGLLTEKYGELTRQSENQAVGVERLTKAWADLRLEIGAAVGPGVNSMAGMLADLLNLAGGAQEARARFAQARQRQWTGARPTTAPIEEFTEEQIDLQIDHTKRLTELDRQSARSRLDATEQYEEQRTNIIGNYAKQTVREAEDFARQRLGQERKLNLAILDVAADSARQRAKWEADLARTIAEQRTDSAEKVAELRADANEKLAELDKDYYRDRERAAGDHRDKLLDAAARLDATAVVEEQRRYARERRDAEEAHKEQHDDTIKDLDKRVAEEQTSLDKSIRQAQEAHQRQLDEQAENDRLRVEELKASFEEQRAQEDEERAIRLGRQATDHQDQLNELGVQHGNRLQQIDDQAAEERAQYNEQFENALANAGKKTEAWITEQEKLTDAAIKDLQRYWRAAAEATKAMINEGDVNKLLDFMHSGNTPLPSRAAGGPILRTGPVLAHAGEYVLNAPTTAAVRNTIGGFDQASLLAALQGGGSRSVTWTGNMNLSISGGANASAQELAAVFEPLLMASLQKIASQ